MAGEGRLIERGLQPPLLTHFPLSNKYKKSK
jgi:hypothetical protein